jgi:hypothetical protein
MGLSESARLGGAVHRKTDEAGPPIVSMFVIFFVIAISYRPDVRYG